MFIMTCVFLTVRISLSVKSLATRSSTDSGTHRPGGNLLVWATSGHRSCPRARTRATSRWSGTTGVGCSLSSTASSSSPRRPLCCRGPPATRRTGLPFSSLLGGRGCSCRSVGRCGNSESEGRVVSVFSEVSENAFGTKHFTARELLSVHWRECNNRPNAGKCSWACRLVKSAACEQGWGWSSRIGGARA